MGAGSSVHTFVLSGDYDAIVNYSDKNGDINIDKKDNVSALCCNNRNARN